MQPTIKILLQPWSVWRITRSRDLLSISYAQQKFMTALKPLCPFILIIIQCRVSTQMLSNLLPASRLFSSSILIFSFCSVPFLRYLCRPLIFLFPSRRLLQFFRYSVLIPHLFHLLFLLSPTLEVASLPLWYLETFRLPMSSFQV